MSHPARRTSPATDIALIAAFAALIAACALLPAISVGGAVPITLQTFAVLLSGAVLGVRRGFLAVLLYLAVGAIGLPVFSGGAGGIAPFVGPSAGYLIAFPLAAALTGFLVERLPRRKVATSIPLIFLAGFGSSIVFIHTLGSLGMALFADMTVPQAFAFDLVFYPGDIVKNILMAVIATAVHRAFPTLLPPRQRVTSGANTAADPDSIAVPASSRETAASATTTTARNTAADTDKLTE